MAFYSVRPRGWPAKPPRPVDTEPNPYESGSRHFAERHRATETDLPGGLVRIDMGEPIKQLPCEAGHSKPVEAAPSPPPERLSPYSPPEPPRSPARPPQRVHREPWGINRDEA